MEKNPNQQHHHPPQEENHFQKLGLIGVVVTDLLGYTGAGIALGYLAWSKWSAPWWVLLLFSLAGLSLAFFRLYQRMR